MTTTRANCLYRLIDRHVEAGLGAKEALVELRSGDRRSLTYEQLQRETHRIACSLRERCGTGHARIALVGSNTLEMLAAWLAVMRAGYLACLVHPNEAPAFYVAAWRKLKPDLILSEPTTAEAAVEPLPQLDLEKLSSGSVVERAAVSDSQPALALMSSGTTGGPKICVHAHRAFASFERSVTRRAWRIRPDDRVLGSSGPYFSFGLQAVHVPLSVGATAVLLPQPGTHADFLEAIERERVTVFLAVPTLYHLLWRRAARSYDLSTLRLSLSAGERLPPLVRRRWEAISRSEMLDSIGTTETFLPYFSEYAGDRAGLQKVAGFSYRFRTVRKARSGATFSVALASDAMMLGYWNAESDQAVAVRRAWFETRDLFTAKNGRYRFVARLSDMVKVGGTWVCPQQLEEALLKCAGVKMAAAVPITTDEGLTRLRAVVVLAADAAERQAQWTATAQAALASTLKPKALNPDRIDIVPALPTTPSGKLLRRAVQEHVRVGSPT